jgi:Stage II sporulation protein E (SpoIIE)/7TM diverse intracellular signalling
VRLPSIAAGLLACALALHVIAQEPRPVRLSAATFDGSGQVDLGYAWRYAPGDGPGRESTAYDDSRWIAVRPALGSGDLSPRNWSGVGWFRRHVLVSPDLQSKSLALRFAAVGSARLYVDGRPVLSVGQTDNALPEIPSARREAAMIRLDGPSHLLAVRYVYPRDAPRPAEGIGFAISLSDRTDTTEADRREWTVAVRGAVMALPIFLALLHLALFAFNPRARENLFYALEMLTFAGIVLREYRDVLLATEGQRVIADRLGRGLPCIAILFGALTYYALRTRPWPKWWRAFVAAGVLLYGASYFGSTLSEYGWMVYFFALMVEIVRIERGKTIVKREGARFHLISFAIFGVTIVLQILINFGVLESVAGVHEVYVFGILSSAAGMSLFLARTLGQSRTQEAENQRKTEELAQARDLQLSMLPREMPILAGLDIAAATQPAAEVGGDYYDVRLAGEDSLLFAFGDATGHGLSAGIVVTAAKALFTSLTPSASPANLLAQCDRAMAGMQLGTLRMCLSLAVVSPRSVTIASAAMPPLLVFRAATGEIDEVGAGGLPLGGRTPSLAEERSSTLAAGDTVLFASDGFAESSNPAGRQLGYDGATAAFRRCAHAQTAKDVIERLFAEVSHFRAGRAQDDDITFVVVRVR